jgi:hypothetical protein
LLLPKFKTWKKIRAEKEHKQLDVEVESIKPSHNLQL